MSSSVSRFDWRPRQAQVWLLAGALAAILIGYTALRGSSFKEVLVVIIACLAAWVLANRQPQRAGLAAWVCMLGLGYRTIHLGRGFGLLPAEVLLWGLLLITLVDRPRWGEATFRMPGWIWIFACFWLWGWIIAIPPRGHAADLPWGEMASEFRDFVLFLPLAVVAGFALAKRDGWKWALTAFFGVGTWIAGLGALEYFYPPIAHMLPGFMANPDVSVAADNFQRASFSFWGSQSATFVILLCTPMAIALWEWHATAWKRVFISAAAVVQIVGVYIGGYRSLWFMTAIEIILSIVLIRKRSWSTAVMVACAAAIPLIPSVADTRAGEVIEILRGQSTDHSAQTRFSRASDAWQSMWQIPWGRGWGGSGWVHSDFLQVGANLGILAALIFVLAYLSTLLRLGRMVFAGTRRGEPIKLGVSLMLSFVAVGGLLTFQGVEVLPQLTLPVWFVWILAEIWMQQTTYRRRKAIAYVQAGNLSPAAHLQLRWHSPAYDSVRPMGGGDPGS